MKRLPFACMLALCACALTFPRASRAQQPAPPPDTLILTDGERLIGHFVRADDKEIVFKSDLAGEVTVKWSNVTELRATEKIAAISKEASAKRQALLDTTPQGTVSANGETISVTQSSGQTIHVPVANVARMLDAATFQREIVNRPGIFEDWTGAVTLALSFVEATQKSNSITTAVSLVRTVPQESWLEKHSRTELDFSSSYGSVTQPGAPTLKTNIYHAAAQQDEYFTPSVYGFGQAIFDHNFSQGLELEQAYVGGLGWTALSNASNVLDLKAGMSYARQQFTGGLTRNLVGSTFSERLNRKFNRGWTLLQSLDVYPAWNNTSALLANGAITFTMPVYKRLNFTTSLIDSYLADPPPGFKKNSVQFATGVTYSLK